MLKRGFKALLVVLLSLLFLTLAFVVRWMSKPPFTRRRLIAIASIFCRGWLRVLGVRVNVNGFESTLIPSPCLLLSNHVSYLDVLVLGASMPCVFVTSVEVQRSFFLGRMAELGGSLFVERRRRHQVREQLQALSEVLLEGFRVVLFPEGTSSNGDTLLPFKSSLLESANAHHVAVVPIIIRYTGLGSAEVTAANRDRIFYYGEMGFFRHLWTLLGEKEIHVSVTCLEAMVLGRRPGRKTLSQEAYAQIRQRYPVLA